MALFADQGVEVPFQLDISCSATLPPTSASSDYSFPVHDKLANEPHHSAAMHTLLVDIKGFNVTIYLSSGAGIGIGCWIYIYSNQWIRLDYVEVRKPRETLS
jgi:hypothetical protein